MLRGLSKCLLDMPTDNIVEANITPEMGVLQGKNRRYVYRVKEISP